MFTSLRVYKLLVSVVGKVHIPLRRIIVIVAGPPNSKFLFYSFLPSYYFHKRVGLHLFANGGAFAVAGVHNYVLRHIYGVLTKIKVVTLMLHYIFALKVCCCQ